MAEKKHVYALVGVILVTCTIFLSYLYYTQPQIEPKTQVFIVIEDGNYTAVIPTRIILSAKGTRIEGEQRFSSSNITEVLEWALNITSVGMK